MITKHIWTEHSSPIVNVKLRWISSNTISRISFTGPCKSSVSNFGLASGCFSYCLSCLSCCLTSSVRFRTPLSGFSESNLSALLMLLVLIKCAKVLLMHSGFLLFEFLVSSLFYIATYLLKSAFTFPSFQSSSLLDKCSLLMVFEALLEDFCSSKFGSKI